MNLSPTAQATLLLTSYFCKSSSKDAKPLTDAEWGRFALWLKEKSLSPANLLVSDPKSLLNGWHDARVGIDRIVQLLNRGHSLALAVEKWQRAGLWVVTRSDSEYPRRLKQRLKTDSPPVLFGCGNKALLNIGGLAVIGSRNASKIDLKFTEQIGAKAASEDIAIISGGARGVDETAMLGSMHSGGPVIGVMADSLLQAATSEKWRKGLMDGNVVLVSPFYPEAGFNIGNAMARNKYIYCLADSSLVIHSSKKGGTLNGAQENLKESWVTLWVKPTNDNNAANMDLVAKGGRWCEADIQSLKVIDLLSAENTAISQIKKEQIDLFSMPMLPGLLTGPAAKTDPEPNGYKTREEITFTSEQDTTMASTGQEVIVEETTTLTIDFYQLFIATIHQLAVSPITLDGLIKNTGLHKSQLNDWLTRATKESVVKKLNRPVRYQFNEKK